MNVHPGWFLVIAGGVLALAGLVWIASPSLPWPGKLPGDVVIQRPNFRLYFPLATCLLLSLLLTGLLWLVRWLQR